MAKSSEARGLTMYELDSAYRSVALELERLDYLDPRDYDGDDFEAHIEREKTQLITRLGAIDDVADIKVEALAKMVQELEAERKVIKAEEDVVMDQVQRLRERRGAAEGRKEWMKTQIYRLLAERPEGEQKVKAATITTWLHPSHVSASIDGDDKKKSVSGFEAGAVVRIAEEWKERLVVVKIDKNEVVREWKKATDGGKNPIPPKDADRFAGFRFVTDAKHVRIR